MKAVLLFLSLIGLALGASGLTRADDQDMPLNAAAVPARGVIRAIDQAALSTELTARVSKINFREGEAFKAGDTLIAFDCERYRAEADAAEATRKEMQLTLDGNQHLEQLRAANKQEVEVSKARFEKAAAEARALFSRLGQCEVKAPFDGRVAELSVRLYEQPQAGRPYMTIVGNDRLEIELIVPSQWLAWMKPGAQFSFDVDETKKEYRASVVRLGASVDSVSQMIKVMAVFEDGVPGVLPGMSGNAHFATPDG